MVYTVLYLIVCTQYIYLKYSVQLVLKVMPIKDYINTGGIQTILLVISCGSSVAWPSKAYNLLIPLITIGYKSNKCQ